MEVVPIWLEVLHTHTQTMGNDSRRKMFNRISKRLLDGMREYGKPLTTHNGRDALIDAWEEACDGCQYLTQAYCEGNLSNAGLLHKQIEIMLLIEQELLLRDLEDTNEREQRG
jgi:hypothetical protein